MKGPRPGGKACILEQGLRVGAGNLDLNWESAPDEIQLGMP